MAVEEIIERVPHFSRCRLIWLQPPPSSFSLSQHLPYFSLSLSSSLCIAGTACLCKLTGVGEGEVEQYKTIEKTFWPLLKYALYAR
jgi:hypothetical protein